MWLPNVDYVDGPLAADPSALTPEGRVRGWHVWLVGAPWDGDSMVWNDAAGCLVADMDATTVEFVPDPVE